MIAIPRDDGGIEVHGSLQCPYYVHTALMRALGLDRDRVVVVQEETGGAFGGKEEYPSILAIHASLLARKAGRPVRMVYDRHEDLAATTKRHPSIIRHRTGVTRAGKLVAQDIDIVFDAGAYTTVSPVVLSRGGIHAGGPVRLPQRPDPCPRGHDQHPAQRRLPGVRRPAVRVRGGDAPGPGRRGPRHVAARDPPPQRVPRGRHHRHRPAAARERRRARRAGGGGRGVRLRAHLAGSRRGRPARRRGARRVGHRDRARLARGGVHRLGRGEARQRGHPSS